MGVEILARAPLLCPAYGIAHVLLAVFAPGIQRAYGPIGASRGGFRGWLGLRSFTELPKREAPGAAAAAHDHDHPRPFNGL